MPIISIIEQPVLNDLKAAYRPVVFKVRATRTDNNAKPPVVYCDVYVNGIYYKTVEKTQYAALSASNSDWQFDIKDAVQEILKTFLPVNGGSNIIEAPEIMASIFCRFRSSGFDSNGFIKTEGTAPIQGTGSKTPVAGTGTTSNSFFAINSTLQHEHNQDLKTHLGFYKTKTWNANVFPLSHRKDGYKICEGDSDFFPIVNLHSKNPICVNLRYKLKGSNTLHAATNCIAPVTCAEIVQINGYTQKNPVTCAEIVDINGTVEKEVNPPVQVAGFIEVQGSQKKVVLTLYNSYVCNLHFNLLGIYDLGGPVSFSAPITVNAGGYTGQYNLQDGIITCMRPSDSGTNTVIYEQTCDGVNYVFTLEIESTVC